MPADALVYLETKDLGSAVGAVINNPALSEAAATLPDVTMLNGMPMSVAVTGFETSEQTVTAENSVLTFQPRFVSVIETGYWNFQVITFVEEHLGLFISEAYGGEATLETSDKHGGRYFVWSGRDGRKAYGLVIGSVIYFGNDETAIENCLAVQRGEVENIAGSGKLSSAGDALAFGYVSPEGIAQLANIAGISIAKRSSEEGEVQSFVARVLPELLRNSVKEMTWTANVNGPMITDHYQIALDPEIARVTKETMSPANVSAAAGDFIPAEAVAATRYNLQDPRLAWRSVLLTARSRTDAVSGEIIAAVASSFFEPFEIADPEIFLGAVMQPLMTVRFDAEGDSSAVIAGIGNLTDIKRSISKEIDLTKPAETLSGAEVWRSADNTITAAFLPEMVIIGDSSAVAKCLAARADQTKRLDVQKLERFNGGNGVTLTFGTDTDSAGAIASVVGTKKDGIGSVPLRWITETQFEGEVMNRTTESPFGLIGQIIAQFASE